MTTQAQCSSIGKYSILQRQGPCDPAGIRTPPPQGARPEEGKLQTWEGESCALWLALILMLGEARPPYSLTVSHLPDILAQDLLEATEL